MGLTTAVQRTGFYGVLDQLGQFLNMEEQKAKIEQQKNKNKYAVQAIVGMFDKLGPNPSMEQINNATKNSIATAYQYDAPEATQVINPILGMAKEEYQNKIQTNELQNIKKVVSTGDIGDTQFQTLQGLTSALQLEHQNEATTTVKGDTGGTYLRTYNKNNPNKVISEVAIQTPQGEQYESNKKLQEQQGLIDLQTKKQMEVAQFTHGLDAGRSQFIGLDETGNAQILNTSTGNITTVNTKVLPKTAGGNTEAYLNMRNEKMGLQIGRAEQSQINAKATKLVTFLNQDSDINALYTQLKGGALGANYVNPDAFVSGVITSNEKTNAKLQDLVQNNPTFRSAYYDYWDTVKKFKSKSNGISKPTIKY